MKHIFIITFVLLLACDTYAQTRRNRTGTPIVPREPTEEEIIKYDRLVEERKNEIIADFLSTLEADDFQKEIIKQYINTYYDERKVLLKLNFERSFDRDQALKKLNKSHFKGIEELISKSDMERITELITGKFDHEDFKKERKKEKRKKRKKGE